MFYVRLLLLMILLYNTEARYGVDYRKQDTYADSDPRGSSKLKIPNPVTNSTSTNATDAMPVTFISSNVTASTEPKYILGKTETNGTVTKHEAENAPYYPDWNDEPTYATTTKKSSYVGYDRITTGDEKQTETAGNTKKRYYDSDGITKKNGTTAPGNSEFWGNKREQSETTTMRRPYHYDWGSAVANGTVKSESTITRKSPWFINNFSHSNRRYYRTGNAHIYLYNTTNFTRDSSARRSNWWNPTTSTRRPFWWLDLTTSTNTTESTNRSYWHGINNNNTFSIHRPTTDYPYYIRSTSSPSFDQSILPNITNATSIYGAVAEFLKKLARTISLSGVKIVPNSNITNVALANGNGNTIFYAYNYF